MPGKKPDIQKYQIDYPEWYIDNYGAKWR